MRLLCKRIAALLIMLALVTTILPVGVSAAQSGDYTYSITGGNAIITGYSGSASSLNIPSSLGGYPVKVIGKKAFYNCKTLTSVTIPSTVTSIEQQAFSFCSALTTLSVASGNSTYYAKNNCIISYSGVLTVGCKKSTIPSDGSVTAIGEYAFGGMTELTSITIPSSVTKIQSGAFYNCKKLGNVTLPSSLSSLGTYAFGSCEAITSVRIPAGVRSIEGTTFSGCSKLDALTVDSGNSLFKSKSNCIINSSGVLVAGCNKSVIPTDGSVTSIGAFAFDGMDRLSSVQIPDSIKSIGSSAFQNCTGLTSVRIPASVTTMGGWAFSGCTGITDIYCSASSQPSGWNSNWQAKCDATVHWGDSTCKHTRTYTSTQDSTCAQTGSKSTICSDCGVVLSTSIIAKKSHSTKTTTTAATCTENGSKVTSCTVCGKQISKETLPATGHDPKTTVTSPTCTKTGTEKTVCNTCGKTIASSLLPATGHEYQGGACVKCGKAEPVCSHSNVEEYTDPPTCTEGGTRLTVCESCGKQVSKESLPATGHTEDEQTTPSTCTETGMVTVYCLECNKLLSIDTLPLASHTYSDGVCTVCGAPEAEESAPDTSESPKEESEEEQDSAESEDGNAGESDQASADNLPGEETSQIAEEDDTDDESPVVAWCLSGLFLLILTLDALYFVLHKEKK